MTTDFHTPLTTGVAANAATFNAVFAELDEAIGVNAGLIAIQAGGADVADAVLKEWTTGEDYELTSITRDSDGVITTATVKWPDGSAGTFTTTTKNSTWVAIDAYSISHSASGNTVTQAAVTRNASGAVTTKPALTIS